MSFELPEDGRTYTEYIVARSKDLIAYNIWEGLQEIRLSKWLNNFRTDERRYFAARVLDTLIYRSDAQTKAMLTHLFQRTIPDIARHYSLPSELYSAVDRLQAASDPNIRLVPVVPATRPPNPSGPLITRRISQHLHFRRKWTIRADQIRATTPFVVFIDDFIGTGMQFSTFLDKQKLGHLVEKRRCCYVAVAGHSRGIGHLREKFPELPVSAVDLLEPSNSLFHEQSLAFPDGTNSIDDAKAFYYEMLKEFRIHPSRFREGYGDLALAYAFSHAVPNNCTPLLWWPHNANWTPLFDR